MGNSEKVQAFWHGGELSPLAWSCLSSFVHFGHHTILYAYDDIKLPAGVIRKDAGSIVSRGALFEWKGLWQPFANIFRYTLIAREGGWWIDTDIVCLTDTLPPGDAVFARELADTIANGQFKLPRGHPILDVLVREASAIGPAQKEWGETGPRLFTRILKESGMAAMALEPPALYPLHWLEAYQLWLPARRRAVEKRLRSAFCLHVYNALLRDLGVDFWTEPPKGSYLAGLYEKYPFHAPLKPLMKSGYRDVVQEIDAYLCQEWVRYHARQYNLDCRRSWYSGMAGARFPTGWFRRLSHRRERVPSG